MTLKIYELQDDSGNLTRFEWYRALRRSAWVDSDAAEKVKQIVSDVETDGDPAVTRYMRQWTDPGFTPDRILVDPRELSGALDTLDPDLREVLEQAIDNVRVYQEHVKPVDPAPIEIGAAELGLRFGPVDSVGLAIPGGKAAYPSTVIMLGVPALVAGVPGSNISVVTPPPTRTSDPENGSPDVSPLVLATCELLGIKRVYRIGGAQAIAALGIGTQTVSPVDFIAGPGNIYTQLAKLQVAGRVGIDGFYGPSEIVVIADESADPSFVASDLIAQAEHDPGRCYLVAWSDQVIERINEQILEQLSRRSRRTAIETSFKEWSAAVLVRDESQAVEVANQIAAEHVTLAVRDPRRWVPKIRHAGELFLGDRSPVAAGDYWAGPSHCLPTGTTARFTSGVSVYTFLKRTGTVHYRGGIPEKAREGIARLAQAEGLDGHAESIRLRSM